MGQRSKDSEYTIEGKSASHMRIALGYFGHHVAEKEFKKYLTSVKGVPEDCLILRGVKHGCPKELSHEDYSILLYARFSNIKLATFLNTISSGFQEAFRIEELPDLPISYIKELLPTWPDIIAVWCLKFERYGLPQETARRLERRCVHFKARDWEEYRLCPVCKHALKGISEESLKPLYKACRFNNNLKISIAEVRTSTKAVFKIPKVLPDSISRGDVGVYMVKVHVLDFSGRYRVSIDCLKGAHQ